MALAILLGLAIGASIGLLGGGGAVLALPVLVYVLGEDAHAATTASLVVVLAGAACGAALQARNRCVCWRHAAVFVVPAVVGVALGTVANRAVSSGVLLAPLAPIMVASAVAMWRRAGADAPAPLRASPCPRLRPRPVACAGLGVGALTSFLGVGGGFVIVPVLTVWLRFPVRSAVGTSIVAIGSLSALALAAHLAAGARLGGGPTLVLALACVAGAAAGAAGAPRVPQPGLARAFAILVGVIAVVVAATQVLG